MWSVKWGVSSVECKVGSVKCGVYETTFNFDTLTYWKTAVLQVPPKILRSQRLHTRHVGATKRAFGARLLPILTLCHRLCSFPHRYCEAFEKSETQDDTCGSLKTSISCEISSNFDILTTSKSPGFVASDTAKPEESQRLKRTHVGA